MPASDRDTLAGARRVAVWGLGREGQAVIRWIRGQGWDPAIEVFLDGPAGDVVPDASSLDVTVVSGSDTIAERLGSGDIDVVVRSPGVPVRATGLQVARDVGIPITTGTTLWFETHEPDNVVVVTGTKGKSTTSALLAHLLGGAGQDVALLGNIGAPLLSHATPPATHDTVVVELSSYQLADLRARIPVGVWLNLHHEHLDWHGSHDAYVGDKGRIVALSTTLVANADDAVVADAAAGHAAVRWVSILGDPVRLGDTVLPKDDLLAALDTSALVGTHHLANLAAALTAAGAVGAEPADLLDHLHDFVPLPHRLQLVHDDGRQWVDDSIATIPEAAIAAVTAFPDAPLTLIAGGFDRGQDHAGLVAALATRGNATVVTLPATGDRLAAALRADAPGLPVVDAPDLAAAVTAADRCTPPGGVVLLSPAAPSYGAFRSFEDRGDQFADLARAMTGGRDG